VAAVRNLRGGDERQAGRSPYSRRAADLPLIADNRISVISKARITVTVHLTIVASSGHIT
jgi:hypothetical protein